MQREMWAVTQKLTAAYSIPRKNIIIHIYFELKQKFMNWYFSFHFDRHRIIYDKRCGWQTRLVNRNTVENIGGRKICVAL